MADKAWDVYRKDEFGNYQCIDTVFTINDYSAMEVCRSLVEHDVYPPDIIVVAGGLDPEDVDDELE